MEWLLKFPHIKEIHVAGFPCVDLSSAKANRLILAGRESGLFTEVLRILELLRSVFLDSGFVSASSLRLFVA